MMKFRIYEDGYVAEEDLFDELDKDQTLSFELIDVPDLILEHLENNWSYFNEQN